MRRLARSTQSGVQGSPPVGPDAKRRVTRLGRRPRPSRLRCRGCAQALKASGRHVRSAEARGQGPRRRARGASDLTLRRSGLPSLPSFARPAGRAGNRSRPALPLGSPEGQAWTTRRRHASGRSGRENDGARPLATNGQIHTCRLLAPPSPAREASGGEGRLGQSPSGVGGASPRRFVDDQARCRWVSWPNRRIILVALSPRPATPHPYPSPPLGFAERGEGGARSRHV